MKKPFSIRVAEETQNRFKAIAYVLDENKDDLLKDMITHYYETLTEDEKQACQSLIKIWKK